MEMLEMKHGYEAHRPRNNVELHLYPLADYSSQEYTA